MRIGDFLKLHITKNSRSDDNTDIRINSDGSSILMRYIKMNDIISINNEGSEALKIFK